MDEMITEFTPWSGLAGGALIGLSAGMMLLLTFVATAMATMFGVRHGLG